MIFPEIPENLQAAVALKVGEIKGAKTREYGKDDTTFVRMSELTGLSESDCLLVLVSKHVASIELHETTHALTREQLVEKYADIAIYKELYYKLYA